MSFASALFDFNGRINRTSYWLLTTLIFIAYIACGMLIAAFRPEPGILATTLLLIWVPTTWSGIAINIKRCHDRDVSGLWILFALIPLAGVLWVIIAQGCMPGTPGVNRFGPPQEGVDIVPDDNQSSCDAFVRRHVRATQDDEPYNPPDANEIYKKIAAELNDGNRDEGLWTKLFADHNGDEVKIKVFYIRNRFSHLSEDAKKTIAANNELKNSAAQAEAMDLSKTQNAQHTHEQQKISQIHALAKYHASNPKLIAEDKRHLLELAGGSFAWHGFLCISCEASFHGEKKIFKNASEFSQWFTATVLPSLLPPEDHRKPDKQPIGGGEATVPAVEKV